MDKLKRLRHTGKYSDITLQCGPKSLSAHKCILYPASGWFSRQDGWNAQTGVFAMNDIVKDYEVAKGDFSLADHELLSLLLDFAYLGTYTENSNHPQITRIVKPEMYYVSIDYPNRKMVHAISRRNKVAAHQPEATATGDTSPRSRPTSTHGPLSIHVKMFMMGWFYEIPGLSLKAVENFKAATEDLTFDVADFAESLVLAYNCNHYHYPQEMKYAAHEALLRHIRGLIHDELIQDAIEQSNGLATKLIQSVAR